MKFTSKSTLDKGSGFECSKISIKQQQISICIKNGCVDYISIWYLTCETHRTSSVNIVLRHKLVSSNSTSSHLYEGSHASSTCPFDNNGSNI